MSNLRSLYGSVGAYDPRIVSTQAPPQAQPPEEIDRREQELASYPTTRAIAKILTGGKRKPKRKPRKKPPQKKPKKAKKKNG